MVYVSVHCHRCGAEYPLYFNRVEEMKCPLCYAEVPEKAFNKIENALRNVAEINKDFVRAHEERGATLFRVEIREHYIASGVAPIATINQ